FLDLGGSSLSAAETVSALRKTGLTAALTVRDVYEARTVAALAARIAAAPPREELVQESRPTGPGAGPKVSRRAPLSAAVHLACILAKLVAGSIVAYVALFHLLPLMAGDLGVPSLLLLAPALALGALGIYAPLSLLVTVAAKKLLIGRYEPGRHPYLGSVYLRNWIVQQAARAIPWEMIEGTVFKNYFLRALGARIGRDVYIHRG